MPSGYAMTTTSWPSQADIALWPIKYGCQAMQGATKIRTCN